MGKGNKVGRQWSVAIDNVDRKESVLEPDRMIGLG